MINPHARHPIFLQWQRLWDADKQWIKEKRGRAALLAKAIGVSRQSVSRWMNDWCKVPAWAFWCIHAWVKQVRLGRDNRPPGA